jgi:membrane-associated phospholipid phosphatase
MGVLVAADTGLALTTKYLPFDPPVAHAVQHVDWGLYGDTFELFTFLGGYLQVLMAAIAVVLVFIVNRRGWLLMAAGMVEGVIYGGMNAFVHRPRPDAQLVHVLVQTPGYGYPSGHAAFYTAWCSLLLLCLGARFLNRALFSVGWVVVCLVVVTVCISRVVEGTHWPSDVIGGLAIGVGWTALVLSVRRLSDPVLERPR